MTPKLQKTTLIQKIKNLEGLTQDERSLLIELVNTKKKYGLVWEDKPEEVEEQLRENLPVLREVVERRIIGAELPVDEPETPAPSPQLSMMPEDDEETDDTREPTESPNHILIEGDNLHALTALTFTHEGKIDVIYIDPPYNTGNKDFKYNDSFVDKEDSYRHSKWLSFMHKRLNIAKRLLSDNGVIFISIDDNESSQLKLLLDELFTEKNFIAQFIHKNNSNKNQAKLVGISTEYLFCYGKDRELLKGVEWKVEKKGAKDIANVFKNLKKQGLPLEEIAVEIKEMYKRPKYAHLSRWNKVNEHGVFKDADLSREGGPKDYTIKNPTTGNDCIVPNRGWGKSYDELIRLQKEKLIWYGDESTPPGLIDYITTDDLSVPDSFLYFDNSVDTKWQKNVFGKLIFDNPKPLEMIESIVKIVLENKGIVLDFFAGSGTTLHATMNLNQEDGGNRQCILVTNNENNICEEVTYERNKRVIEGYTNSKGEFVKGLKNNNLRYYRSEFVGRERTVNNKIKITRLATELLCIKEDIYEEITQLGNFALDNKEVRAFARGNLYLLVIYTETAIEDMVSAIEEMVGETDGEKPRFKVYVFSNGQYPYTEEFEDVAEFVTLCALPDAIYKAYQHVLPSRTPRDVPQLEDPTAEEMEETLEDQPDLFNQPQK